MLTHYSYASPLGTLTLHASESALVAIDFPQETAETAAQHETTCPESPVLRQTCKWLDLYFAGRQPDWYPPMEPAGTPFRQEVWDLLLAIPSGEVTSYAELARTLAEARGIPRMAAQAVGGAVGANPIPIIIPCHRVIGSDGSLTGYGGGIQFKVDLLEHEQVDTQSMKWPAPR